MKISLHFLKIRLGDEECMEEDILEALYDFPSQKELVVSSLDEIHLGSK